MFDKSGMIHAKAMMAPGSNEAAISAAVAGGKDETILSSGEHHDHGSMAGLCQYVGETRTRHHTCNRRWIVPKVRRIARDLEDDQNADSVSEAVKKKKNTLTVDVDRGLCRISKVEAGVLNVGDAHDKHLSATQATEAGATAMTKGRVTGINAKNLRGELTGETYKLEIWTARVHERSHRDFVHDEGRNILKC